MKKKQIKFKSKDFDVSLLPNTRKEQFGDLVKNEWRNLLLIGFTSFLFAIPFIGFILFRYLFISAYEASFDPAIGEALIKFNVIRTNVLLELAYIPLLMIFSLSLAGNSRILRLMIHGDGFFYLNDFLKGIKQNFKPYLLQSFIFFTATALCKFLYIFLYNASTNGDSSFFIALFPFMAIILVLAPIIIFTLSQVATYNMKFTGYLKNGIKIAIGKYLYSLLFIFIPFIIYFTFKITGMNGILESILLLIIFIFIFPFYLLFIALFSTNVFDKTINLTKHKELLNKGLASYQVVENNVIEMNNNNEEKKEG